MSEDYTRKFSENDRDLILTAIRKMDSRLQGVEKKVDGLEKTVNERFYKVVDDIGELQAGQKRLEEGQQAMRADVGELNTTVRTVNRDQIVVNDSVRRMQLDFHDVNERLHKLIANNHQQNSTT